MNTTKTGGISLEGLKALLERAKINGTLDRWVETAVEWAEQANAHIDELNRRAPAAEQHMCRKECVDECLWPDCRHKPADHIKVDGIRVDADYVRRMRGLLDQRDFTIQRMEAEQQQQEPVVYMREGATEVMHNFRFDKPGSGPWVPLCKCQQPQAQGEPVACAPLQWSAHLKPNKEIPYDHLLAQTPFGRILITWKSWKNYWDLIIDEHPVETARGCYAGSTIDEAIKTAEQKYFDALKGALLEQPRAAVPDVTAWLVEDAHPNGVISYRTMDQTGIHWTTNAHKAIRFARREDAEMFAAGDEDAWHIVEHMWCAAAPAQPGDAQEGEG